MARCYICEGVGIHTAADASSPIVVNGTKFNVCKDCHLTHQRALEYGTRTMFDRLFPDVKRIKARADARPRQQAPAEQPTVLPVRKPKILPAD